MWAEHGVRMATGAPASPKATSAAWTLSGEEHATTRIGPILVVITSGTRPRCVARNAKTLRLSFVAVMTAARICASDAMFTR